MHYLYRRYTAYSYKSTCIWGQLHELRSHINYLFVLVAHFWLTFSPAVNPICHLVTKSLLQQRYKDLEPHDDRGHDFHIFITISGSSRLFWTYIFVEIALIYSLCSREESVTAFVFPLCLFVCPHGKTETIWFYRYPELYRAFPSALSKLVWFYHLKLFCFDCSPSSDSSAKHLFPEKRL